MPTNATARRGQSRSPWFAGRPGDQARRTSRELMPASSWWVEAAERGDFYETAHHQARRLAEGGGPLVSYEPKERES